MKNVGCEGCEGCDGRGDGRGEGLKLIQIDDEIDWKQRLRYSDGQSLVAGSQPGGLADGSVIQSHLDDRARPESELDSQTGRIAKDH